MKKLRSFTLAEVLITLAVIGVLASMTIPAMVNKTNDAELKVMWKKNYAELTQGFDKMRGDNGGTLQGLWTSEGDFTNFFNTYKNYFKVKNNDYCTGPEGQRANIPMCYHQPGTYYRGDTGAPIDNSCFDDCGPGDIAFELDTGAIMKLSLTTCSKNQMLNPYGDCAVFTIDVNGYKKPNTHGKDSYLC